MPACRSRRCAMRRRCRRARARGRFFTERLRELAGAARRSLPSGRRARAQAPRDARASSPSAPSASSRASPRRRRVTRGPQPTRRELPAAARRDGQRRPPTARQPRTRRRRRGDRRQGPDAALRRQACIHSRFCVTGAPNVFLANVQGPVDPSRRDAESSARRDRARLSVGRDPLSAQGRPRRRSGAAGQPVGVREDGPYAVRADMRLDGEPVGYRATLCRCGASKNKPFCDGSHHEVELRRDRRAAERQDRHARGARRPARDRSRTRRSAAGARQSRDHSGTGRVVARVQSARLCRCGGSNNKPFCDGTHARIGFRS